MTASSFLFLFKLIPFISKYVAFSDYLAVHITTPLQCIDFFDAFQAFALIMQGLGMHRILRAKSMKGDFI